MPVCQPLQASSGAVNRATNPPIPRAPRRVARLLYARVVEQARRPVFYAAGGVPDTLDGRFEMVALHCFLLLHRLKQQAPKTAKLSQALFDLMFDDMDTSLREMGAGDLGVGRRVKRMAAGFLGRIAAYDAGLAGDAAALAEALRRNVYGTVAGRPRDAAAMVDYVRGAAAALDRQPLARLMQGEVDFAEPEFGR